MLFSDPALDNPISGLFPSSSHTGQPVQNPPVRSGSRMRLVNDLQVRLRRQRAEAGLFHWACETTGLNPSLFMAHFRRRALRLPLVSFDGSFFSGGRGKGRAMQRAARTVARLRCMKSTDSSLLNAQGPKCNVEPKRVMWSAPSQRIGQGFNPPRIYQEISVLQQKCRSPFFVVISLPAAAAPPSHSPRPSTLGHLCPSFEKSVAPSPV